MASLNPRGSVKMLKVLFYQSCRRRFITTASTFCSSSEKVKEPLLSVHSSPSHDIGMHAVPLSVKEQCRQDTYYEPTLIENPSTATKVDSAQVTSHSLESQSSQEAMSDKSVNNSELQFSKRDLSSVLLNRVDPRTLHKVYYFDSLAFSKRLEARGFTRDQAEACVECLLEIIGTTLEHQSRHMVTKSEQRIAEQQLQTEIMSVKKDMVLLQKSEFSALRTETEKISSDIARIESHFQDEVVKLKGQFTLDVNLERGRAVEAHAASEKNLQILNNKIETEIAHLKTTYEVYRNDIFKYAAGTVLTCTTLIIGFIRLWT